MRRLATLLLLVTTLTGVAACSGKAPCDAAAQAAGTCARILFIGNSYTSVNDLPGTFQQLAVSGGQRVETASVAPGGATLATEAASADTISEINSSRWNVVVLQEQSQIPAAALSRTTEMDPAVRSLVAAIRVAAAKPLLYLTWGHRDGWPENGLAGYAAMQAQLTLGYTGIANELATAIAPVGAAWSSVHATHPDVPLWQDDGSHPTLQGTYLAACVFYAAIFNRSPQGLSFGSGLAADQVQVLQSAAAHAVLDNPAQWNLPPR